MKERKWRDKEAESPIPSNDTPLNPADTSQRRAAKNRRTKKGKRGSNLIGLLKERESKKGKEIEEKPRKKPTADVAVSDVRRKGQRLRRSGLDLGGKCLMDLKGT